MFTCEMSEGKKIETQKYMTGMITAEWNDTIMCYAPFIEFRSGVKISDNDLNDFIENHWEEVYNQNEERKMDEGRGDKDDLICGISNALLDYINKKFDVSLFW